MNNSNNNTYVESLKGVFGDLASLTPEKLQGFVGETMKQLSDLREQLESTDPKVREEGIRAAQELKAVLESQMEGMAKLIGEDPAQLAALMGNPSPMDVQDQEILENAKEQFKYLKSSFSPENKNKKVHQKVDVIG
jgi:hypothetical protein